MRVEQSVLINRPLEVVFAFVTCYENDPRWCGLVLESEQISGGPLGVGTKLRRVARLVGQKLTMVGEIIEYEPNSCSCFKSISSPVSQIETRYFEASPNGTCFTFEVEEDLAGFLKLADPAALRIIRRQIKADVSCLKELLEAQA